MRESFRQSHGAVVSTTETGDPLNQFRGWLATLPTEQKMLLGGAGLLVLVLAVGGGGRDRDMIRIYQD